MHPRHLGNLVEAKQVGKENFGSPDIYRMETYYSYATCKQFPSNRLTRTITKFGNQNSVLCDYVIISYEFSIDNQKKRSSERCPLSPPSRIHEPHVKTKSLFGFLLLHLCSSGLPYILGASNIMYICICSISLDRL